MPNLETILEGLNNPKSKYKAPPMTAPTQDYLASPEFVDYINNLRQQYAMTGTDPGIQEVNVGDNLLDYFTSGAGGNMGTADQAALAQRAGIPLDQYNYEVDRVNKLGQENRPSGGILRSAFQAIGEHPLASMLAIAAGGTAASGGFGAGAAGTGAADGLTPITVGATPLAGGIPAVDAAGAAAWGGGAIPALTTAPTVGGGALSSGTGSAIISGTDSFGGAALPEGLEIAPNGLLTGSASEAGGGVGALSGGIPAVGAESAVPAGGGLFSNMGGQLKNGIMSQAKNPDGSINWLGTAGLVGKGAGLVGALSGGSGGGGAVPPNLQDMTPLRQMSLQRTRNDMPESDYFTYGQTGGEHQFFGPEQYQDVGAGAAPVPQVTQPGPRIVDNPPPNLSRVPIKMEQQMADGGGVRGVGTGRSDSIEALLSDGEYVMDAETVSLLGDGSNEAGSRRLDELRANLRKHKGEALAKGKFTPAARHPVKYMGKIRKAKAEGGRTNPQLGVTELPPPSSNFPAPLPNAKGIYSGDVEDTVARIQFLQDKLRKIAPVATPRMEMMKEALAALGPQATEQELMRFIEQKTGRAKGGRIRGLAGGIPHDPEMRSAELDAIRRMVQAVKEKHAPPARPPMEDSTEEILMDRRAVAKARERLEAIKKLSMDRPIKKAEGGPVHELEAFADRLEQALKGHDASAVTRVATQMDSIHPKASNFFREGFAKGGRVPGLMDKFWKFIGEDQIAKPPMRPFNKRLSPEDVAFMVQWLKENAPESRVLSYDPNYVPKAKPDQPVIPGTAVNTILEETP